MERIRSQNLPRALKPEGNLEPFADRITPLFLEKLSTTLFFASSRLLYGERGLIQTAEMCPDPVITTLACKAFILGSSSLALLALHDIQKCR